MYVLFDMVDWPDACIFVFVPKPLRRNFKGFIQNSKENRRQAAAGEIQAGRGSTWRKAGNRLRTREDWSTESVCSRDAHGREDGCPGHSGQQARTTIPASPSCRRLKRYSVEKMNSRRSEHENPGTTSNAWGVEKSLCSGIPLSPAPQWETRSGRPSGAGEGCCSVPEPHHALRRAGSHASGLSMTGWSSSTRSLTGKQNKTKREMETMNLEEIINENEGNRNKLFKKTK